MEQDSTAEIAYRAVYSDPYLEFKPLFAYSYATQLVLNGVILALLVVLLAHLLFTVQYHYPLARLNCVLQISGVGITLLAVVATLVVILEFGSKQTSQWPYMNDFMAVKVPKTNWNQAESVAWYTMEAVSSGIVQITHIQFLTLLYPSELEARLIFGLLGPIAVASSAMTFTSLSSGATAQYGMIVRNICNSALSLLFTTALFLWGFVVNRKRAWRTDGGTAAFGAGALVLAVSSTAVNFLEVKIDKLSWLQHLLWSIILWQSWLGWWWWVGSGMGIGEVEDMMEKEHKRARKAERRQAKKDQKLAARQPPSTGSATGSSAHAGGSASAGWSGLLSSSLSITKRRKFPRVNTASSSSSHGPAAFELQTFADATPRQEDGQSASAIAGPSNYRERDDRQQRQQESSTTRHRSHTIPDNEREREITLPLPNTTPRRPRNPGRTISSSSSLPPRTTANGQSTSSGPGQAMSSSSQSSSDLSGSTPTTLHFPTTLTSAALFPFTLFNHYVSRLGRAHDEAAKRKVRERTERVRARDPMAQEASAGAAGGRVGWGLGEYGVREARDGEGRLREARRELRSGTLLRAEDEGDELVEEEEDEDGVLVRGGEGEAQADEGGWVDEEIVREPTPRASTESSRPARRRVVLVDAEVRRRDSTDRERSRRRGSFRRGSRGAASEDDPTSDDASSQVGMPPVVGGWSWWGPLKRWRLQDRTTY